jgi:poly-gamma-glutamate synthesis protein (capsule biosynthesis protein)
LSGEAKIRYFAWEVGGFGPEFFSPKKSRREKMSNRDTVTLCAVGDVVAFHNDPESAFEHVGPILREADITFAQNERSYTSRAEIFSRRGGQDLTTAKNAEALKLGGFDVISFASNNCMHLGFDAMLETIDVLKKLGFTVIGAGRNLEEARKPAIIERKGTKVAFLAYVSVMRPAYAAGLERPGCAPLRVWTLYHQIDYQPGTPPQILTFPKKEDLEAVIAEVKKAKKLADVVALSLHWGIHFVPNAPIAMYQKEVAHAVIDAGADIILGSHPHQLNGIEVYKGKPIFYSMGNFIFDYPHDVLKKAIKEDEHMANLLNHYGWRLDPEWDIYSFPPESRKSMIVKCNIVSKKIQRACFLPILINKKAQPQTVSRKDKNFDELFHYMKEITENQGLETEFSIEDNEIVVSLT